jgi:hypothetical protein
MPTTDTSEALALSPEERREVRVAKLAQFARKGGGGSARATQLPGRLPAPKLTGLGDRSDFSRMPWNTVSHSDFETNKTPRIPTVKTKLQASLGYTVHTKYKQKVQAETDLLSGYWGWHGIIEPEYDLLEPYTIVDTEAFLAQALQRKHSLMFRNGFAVTGENQNFVRYIERRFAQLGYVSGQSMENFIKDILWNLLICSNCILIKVRDNAASGGVANDKNGNKTPIAGYVIVPPQTIFPYLDGYGQVIKWRRFFGDGRPFKDYDVDDVVHFYENRKPGHLFGTPRLWPVRDDIYALRRLEENIELLLVQHLFPLLHVKVGTPEAPCEYMPDGISEVDMYKAYIQSMPKEGVLVTDERITVECVGVAKEGANYEPMVAHFKKRIFTGLGVSAMDMGETDATKSAADNVSQNLKDAIKALLSWFTEQFRMLILKDLFTEAPFHLSVQNAVADVTLDFHELDPDNQIKMETHATNAYNNQAITHPELRRALKRKPLTPEEEKDLHFNKHTMLENEFHANQELKLAKIAAATKPVGAKKKKAGSKKKPAKTAPAKPAASARKVVKTMTQPTNQYGTNHGPHKAKTSRGDLSRMLYDRMVTGEGQRTDSIITALFKEFGVTDSLLRERVERFLAQAGNCDIDDLWILIQAAFSEPAQDDLELEESLAAAA